ncbi:sugar nucleotide-binding protein [Glycomyces tritici]|uniref:Sugar nucleotide-binding protein n=1 Tax=Glycomyces tritici TaxID=2665176 RepID=A0ABT7YM21_9ACTN|nr:NAD-dependent epimerase/dehydratase family protein [Glycomyces tritici]MDN3239683.1 sugar nucleotide-binding protein [Glycomyces tritici]
MSLRLLVIGASGFLGAEVVNLAGEVGHAVTGTAYSTRGNGLTQLDVRDRDAFARLNGDVMPDAVINTAAVMNDWTTTALAPIGIAAACAASGTRFVHVSSDAVRLVHGRLPVPRSRHRPRCRAPRALFLGVCRGAPCCWFGHGLEV